MSDGVFDVGDFIVDIDKHIIDSMLEGLLVQV
jgi:hypothetical protein